MQKYLRSDILGKMDDIMEEGGDDMDIWISDCWKMTYANTPVRKGLRIKTDKDVDDEVKRACKEFCKWLRTQYTFPIRVPVYIKSSCKIKAMDGDMVYGTFFEPDDDFVEPYIRIAAGDYPELLSERGKDNALATILQTIAHELTHYFQWVNKQTLTPIGMEWQATRYSRLILNQYAETREHP